MTDEKEEALITPPPPVKPYEPFEWYKAFSRGKLIDEGPTPLPDDIREKATEIQWSNPTKDEQHSMDTLPPNADVETMDRFVPEHFGDDIRPVNRFDSNDPRAR